MSKPQTTEEIGQEAKNLVEKIYHRCSPDGESYVMMGEAYHNITRLVALAKEKQND